LREELILDLFGRLSSRCSLGDGPPKPSLLFATRRNWGMLLLSLNCRNWSHLLDIDAGNLTDHASRNDCRNSVSS
jgi:hypothetical protein